MKNKTTKNLIILGAIVFSFILTNSVSAYTPKYAFSNDSGNYQTDPAGDYFGNQGYSQYDYYQQSGYGSNNYYNPNNQTPKTSVVNNYYYPTTTKVSTVTPKTNTNPTSTQKVTTTPNSNLGASAYNSSDLTALSLRGSGGFMPSSIWQWIFVVILILAIIIVSRMFVHKPTPGEHTH